MAKIFTVCVDTDVVYRVRTTCDGPSVAEYFDPPVPPADLTRAVLPEAVERARARRPTKGQFWVNPSLFRDGAKP
jgi:hypothetical protein